MSISYQISFLMQKLIFILFPKEMGIHSRARPTIASLLVFDKFPATNILAETKYLKVSYHYDKQCIIQNRAGHRLG